MINTVDLDSYYPGYDEYCEPNEEINLDDDPTIDDRIDELVLERIERKESDNNGICKEREIYNN